jgi:D-glycero-alpha-D-manno-heptose 1-phosphate guanylyltransferase
LDVRIVLDYRERLALKGLRLLRRVFDAQENDDPIFVLNGDTFLQFSFTAMYSKFTTSGAEVGIALKEMPDVSRYGRVVLTEDGAGVETFEEKGIRSVGLINAGVYLLRPRFFNKFNFPTKYSLEVDCFMKKTAEINFSPHITQGYFIDIGIPDDLKRAQSEWKSLL